MRFFDYIKTALENIGSGKLRSLLTSLGIIIGIGSVVLITSIGAGVSDTITGAFSGLGTTQMTISSSLPQTATGNQRGIRGGGGGAGEGGGLGGGSVAGTLTLDDAAALRNVEGVAAAAPVVQIAAKVAGPVKTLDMGVTGTTSDYGPATGKTLVSGRNLEENASEVVLNESAAKALFGAANSIGQSVKINDQSYTVVGIFADTKSPFSQGNSGGEGNAAVYMPVGPALAIAGAQKVSQIVVAAKSPEVVDATLERIRTALVPRHSNVQDFTINSFQQLTASFSQIFNTLTLFLSAIAGISLLVGGIGIMNIMLVTVTERTREIGIAKAIGATSRSVVIQFLVEAVTLSVIGGVLGLLVAWLGTLALDRLVGLPAVVSLSSILIAVGVSAAIGIFFGVAPAWRAARLDPIVALRHE